jgi:hypothetical protein
MNDLHKSVLEEFVQLQDFNPYNIPSNHPKNLSELEKEPMDDDVYDIPESKCGVDVFIHKNRGWR